MPIVLVPDRRLIVTIGVQERVVRDLQDALNKLGGVELISHHYDDGPLVNSVAHQHIQPPPPPPSKSTDNGQDATPARQRPTERELRVARAERRKRIDAKHRLQTEAMLRGEGRLTRTMYVMKDYQVNVSQPLPDGRTGHKSVLYLVELLRRYDGQTVAGADIYRLVLDHYGTDRGHKFMVDSGRSAISVLTRCGVLNEQ